MSIHIGAEMGEIAKTVLLPGDPLRAKYIAENILENSFCYNQVRGMYGFTGFYKGKRVSVQGTGMGIPSTSIYVNELISEYDVQNLIRIGTCGSMQENIEIRDIVLAISASTNSNMNRIRFNGMDFAPAASFKLLKKAFEIANERQMKVNVGNILSSDVFYNDHAEQWKMWANYGVLVTEMETAELYTLAAKYGVNALSILTVSDSIVTNDLTSSEEREKTFIEMVEIALEVAE